MKNASFFVILHHEKFVDVIVPLPIANQYTYSLPQEMEEMVQIGCRVVVPFGKKSSIRQ